MQTETQAHETLLTSSGSRTPVHTLVGTFSSRTFHAAYIASHLWSLREALAIECPERREALARAHETRITAACYSVTEDLLPDCDAVLVAVHELVRGGRP